MRIKGALSAVQRGRSGGPAYVQTPDLSVTPMPGHAFGLGGDENGSGYTGEGLSDYRGTEAAPSASSDNARSYDHDYRGMDSGWSGSNVSSGGIDSGVSGGYGSSRDYSSGAGAYGGYDGDRGGSLSDFGGQISNAGWGGANVGYSDYAGGDRYDYGRNDDYGRDTQYGGSELGGGFMGYDDGDFSGGNGYGSDFNQPEDKFSGVGFDTNISDGIYGAPDSIGGISGSMGGQQNYTGSPDARVAALAAGLNMGRYNQPSEQDNLQQQAYSGLSSRAYPTETAIGTQRLDALTRSTLEGLKAIESRGMGGYGALGKTLPSGSYKGDRAYGAYQVMGNNVGPWTQDVLGTRMTPRGFLSNPNAQEAVAYSKVRDLIDKHGPYGAAASWLGGSPSAMNRQDIVTGIGVGDYASRAMLEGGLGPSQWGQYGPSAPTPPQRPDGLSAEYMSLGEEPQSPFDSFDDEMGGLNSIAMRDLTQPLSQNPLKEAMDKYASTYQSPQTEPLDQDVQQTIGNAVSSLLGGAFTASPMAAERAAATMAHQAEVDKRREEGKTWSNSAYPTSDAAKVFVERAPSLVSGADIPRQIEIPDYIHQDLGAQSQMLASADVDATPSLPQSAQSAPASVSASMSASPETITVPKEDKSGPGIFDTVNNALRAGASSIASKAREIGNQVVEAAPSWNKSQDEFGNKIERYGNNTYYGSPQSSPIHQIASKVGGFLVDNVAGGLTGLPIGSAIRGLTGKSTGDWLANNSEGVTIVPDDTSIGGDHENLPSPQPVKASQPKPEDKESSVGNTPTAPPPVAPWTKSGWSRTYLGPPQNPEKYGYNGAHQYYSDVSFADGGLVPSFGAGGNVARRISRFIHGTLSDNLPSIRREGLRPQVGEYTKGFYGDDATDAVFLADEVTDPRRADAAIRGQVARKLGKHPSDLSPAEVRDHGAAVFAHEDPYDIYKYEDSGYGSNKSGGLTEEVPSQAESGDFFTTKTLTPSGALKGDALLRYLRSRGVSGYKHGGAVPYGVSKIQGALSQRDGGSKVMPKFGAGGKISKAIRAFHATSEPFDNYDFARFGETTLPNVEGTGVEDYAMNLSRLGAWAADRSIADEIAAPVTLPVEISGKGKTFKDLEALEKSVRRAGGPEAYRERLIKNGYGHVVVAKDDEFGVKSFVGLDPSSFRIVKE